MENKFIATEDVWFIVKGEKVHYGKIKTGGTLETKNPIDTYTTEEEWKTELTKLGLVKDSMSFKIPEINNNK
jgi:hypothetical protein